MDEMIEIQTCQNCNLCNNQRPLLDRVRKANVFWVGLSAVKVGDINVDIPLSPNTNSGKLLYTVEKSNSSLTFYKTNLVKCLPLKNDKIRYPNSQEIKCCYKNLQIEINNVKPKIVFLLGKIVIDFFSKVETKIDPSLNNKFKYKFYNINGVYYIPVHHPSYILVYKRKQKSKYLENISKILLELSHQN